METIDLIRNAPVRAEYTRIVSLHDVDDQYASQYTISLLETIDAHFLLADFFYTSGEGIAGIGPKNIDMLHSALARQTVGFGGRQKFSSNVDICATLMFGLIKNHPFYDANKRTAFLVSLLHLQKIGRTPTVDHQEYEDFIVKIAEDDLKELPQWGNVLGNEADKSVAVISWFLKRNSRSIEKRARSLTYNELKSMFNAKNLGFENPRGNKIDLVKYEEDHTAKNPKYKRLARVGFHSWTSEISRTDLKVIREASELDIKHGIDSESFYNDIDGPLDLIKKYKEPLERLAFR